MSGYLRLQAVQIVGGALRVSGGLEDAPLVAFERAQPRLDISGVIVAAQSQGRGRRRCSSFRARQRSLRLNMPHCQNATSRTNGQDDVPPSSRPLRPRKPPARGGNPAGLVAASAWQVGTASASFWPDAIPIQGRHYSYRWSGTRVDFVRQYDTRRVLEVT
jgi:hypothetical protein